MFWHDYCFDAAYYRGAMGILLVYDVTDESSFNSISISLSHVILCVYVLFCTRKQKNYDITILIHNLSCSLILYVQDIRNWIRNIEQHASDNVNKILIGNKADMDESKRVNIAAIIIVSRLSYYKYWLEYNLWQAVPTSRGQALADEYGIKFFETVSLCSFFL